MGVFWAACLIVAASALAVGAMLLVRRRSPDGGHFKDGDRAAGVFGVLATGFSVMLGLIVVLAFTSYDESRAGAETEARLVTQQFQTAQFLPAAVAGPLGDQLICYARSVAYEEWPRLESGTGASVANRWAIPLFRTTKATRPVTPAEQAAYSLWLDQTSERQEARQDRLYSADGVITAPLWIVLLFTAVVIFGFMLFFADRGEHPVVQAALVGSVVAVIVATLLLIRVLDEPYRPGVGSLEPRAMERALVSLEFQRRVVGRTTPLPCSATGAPRA